MTTTTITTRQAVHPDQARGFDTTALRDAFHIDGLFRPDEVNLTYWHTDRLVVGGAMPATKPLALEAPKAIGTAFFLERREATLVNVGAPAVVTVDGTSFELGSLDMLYLGRGAKEVTLASAGSEPTKLYLVSAPAHASHPHRLITLDQAKKLHLGSPETANVRTLYQFVHPDVCASCQLLLGITRLEPGSIWNTMPAHLHDRRCEAYLYFDMAPETRVFHLMGEADETRHLVVANEEAILSPGWSIHSGAGTSRYSFVWAMAGDNQDFGDMDMVPMGSLR